MIKHFIILIFIFSNLLFSAVINVDETQNSKNILSSSFIYLDETQKLIIKDIEKTPQKFTKNDKEMLPYGYSPKFNVWVKFTLKNTTDKHLIKILEYGNALTTHLEFYDRKENTMVKDGLFFINEKRNSINPAFKIELKPNETKTFYLKASSHITTLIVKLTLYNDDKFYANEIKHQIILSLFFGAMCILAIYNIFIFFFTKDISYLYYVLYIFGVVVHHMFYVGIANIYLLSQEGTKYVIEFSSLIVALPVFALGLFTKYFLQTQQYPKANFILSAFLYMIPVFVVFFILTDDYDKYRNALTLLLLIYLLILTIYAFFKKNKQANFILFGWFIFVSTAVAMFLSSAGIFNVYSYFPYLVEISFVTEAIIFSIALANKITILQKEKEDVSKKLILQQQNEQERLKIKVNEQTKDLKVALDEKGLLLKELNHRVKNNMQTIVSLIRLQGDEIDDKNLHDIFLTVQNRINAMSHLHELLYKQDNITHIDAYEYFDLLIDEVKDSYENSDIEINIKIKTDLQMGQAIYCGLILNELLTNSFKYAFPDGIGNIDISLEKHEDEFVLIISDDGIGYDNSKPTNSIGLVLVKTLATQQLKGKIETKTNDGVRVHISWRENE